VRLASFNVENMFRRPIALNQATWSEGRPTLERFAALQALLEQPVYSAADKETILGLVDALGLSRTDEGPMVILRRSRGNLLRRRRGGAVEVSANGRGDWIGWLELKREAVDEKATRNTARVIDELAPDVLAVIEAEDRPALVRFNRDVLGPLDQRQGADWTYAHALLVDGNDERGIDVGLMTQAGFDIVGMLSHIDDPHPPPFDDRDGPVFSRDCAEYRIATPGGHQVLVLINHFKSKGYGSQQASTAKRAAQATRVAEIYRQRREEGTEHIVVLGDLNDTPDSEALSTLLSGTDLRDVSELDGFEWNGRQGTFGTGNDKIDYLLCSPAVFDRVTAGGVFRKGVWRGPRVRNAWPMLDTITSADEAASDHAVVWADVALS
jgi:endonuclease/exonuclease/phosphatase family metal-dependent hydrolase